MEPDEKKQYLERRADNGAAAVRAGTPDFRLNDSEGIDVSDALANIMHYCARANLDFTDATERAARHFDAEQRGEDI
jgi:hypothetical protein